MRPMVVALQSHSLLSMLIASRWRAGNLHSHDEGLRLTPCLLPVSQCVVL